MSRLGALTLQYDEVEATREGSDFGNISGNIYKIDNIYKE